MAFKPKMAFKGQSRELMLETDRYLPYEEMHQQDLSNWMGSLPNKEIPLSLIIMPGSHDTFTYSLDKKSSIGPDESKKIKDLVKRCGPLGRSLVYRWSVCQRLNCLDQLANGVRYLDFRLAKNKLDGTIRVIHALFGCTVKDALNQVKTFIDKHQSEILVLDFQHNYALNDKDRQYLSGLTRQTFGNLLEPAPKNGDCPTLAAMLKANRRIIAVNPFTKGDSGLFWPRNSCLNPWANTTNTNTLGKFLDSGLKSRDRKKLFVSQAILTPSTSTIVKYLLFGSLESKLAKQCNEFVDREWLQQRGLEGQPNIIMVDFVDMREMAKKIVQLNWRRKCSDNYLS